jgi:hypothetical protein
VMKRPDAGWERLVPDVVATIEASMS